jgi:hypothetical protein
MGLTRPPDPTEPFTTATWLESGKTFDELRRKDFQRVFHSVWILRNAIDADTRIKAALALHPASAIASHFSAGRLHDFPLPEHCFEHVMVFAHEDRRYRPEIKSHVATRRRPTVKIRGIVTSDLVSTFVDLAGYLGLVDLVCIGDWMVRHRPITPEQLVQACLSSEEHHAGAAAYAAGFVRAGVDSPMESRLRMLIVLGGLPEPDVNHIVRNLDGSWRRRYDLWYPEAQLVVEYDGRQHAEDTAQWETDLDRREEFDDEGIRVLVVTASGIFRQPRRTLERVRRQLVLRGFGSVPPISDAWEQYFAA